MRGWPHKLTPQNVRLAYKNKWLSSGLKKLEAGFTKQEAGSRTPLAHISRPVLSPHYGPIQWQCLNIWVMDTLGPMQCAKLHEQGKHNNSLLCLRTREALELDTSHLS